MSDKVLKLLVEKLEDKVSQIQDNLGSGAAKDYVEYKAMVGEIKGLLTARSFIKDLHERLNQDDDDE
jgi:hypothetical protein